MTRRHDRDRDTRRVVETVAAAYVCPDCGATKTLTQREPYVYLLAVEHDETCPNYRRIADGPR